MTFFNASLQGNYALWLLYGVVGDFADGYLSYLDSAGVYGRGADSPANQATYNSQPVVPASSGTSAGGQFNGAGGWTLYCHFSPVTSGSGQIAVGAQFFEATSTTPVTSLTELSTGSWQASSSTRDSCPFCLDLLDTQPPVGEVITPATAFTVGTATSWNLLYNGTDGSGETARYLNIWAGASTWDAPNSTPALPAPLESWTPSSPVISSSLLNGSTGVADVLNFLQYPPMFRSALGSVQSIPSGTNTTVAQAATPSVDNFGGQDGTTGYVVKRDGLYLAHATTVWSASSSGQRATGLTINGTLYWGPGYPAASSGVTVSTKTQVFSLLAGDVVQVTCRQNSGSAVPLDSSHQTRLILTWLGETTTAGSAATAWTPPDTGYRWQAGALRRDLPGLFTEHLANDLGFLTCHPYFLGYQATAQSGLAQNQFSGVTLDTIQGIVHMDPGDPWKGWSGGAWAGPQPGWYLVAGEMFATAASGAASVVAGLSVPTSGGFSPSVTPDWYQHMVASTNSALPPGGTIVGLYYLNPGETISPQIMAQDYGGTYGTTASTSSDGGIVESHLEAVWVSE